MAKAAHSTAGIHRLTAVQVKNAKPGDKLSDGGGLRLDADARGGRSWVFRYKSPVTGKERYMGLGPAPVASTDKARESLASARDRAAKARELLLDGKDPLEDRKAGRAAVKAEASRAITFKAYAEQYITGKEAGWKNAVHRQQWRNSCATMPTPTLAP